jgi:MFS family permease
MHRSADGDQGVIEAGRLDPRYLVVVGACLTQFTVIGLLFSYGLFFEVFETEFGWSRTVLSSAASLAFLMMGVLASPMGRLSDRFGPRPVLAMSGALYGLGVGLIAGVAEPWQLLLIFSAFIGLGMSTHDVVTLSTVARWFERRRGVMTGVVKTGTAIGQVVIPPLAAVAIASLGWRSAALGLGAAAAGLLVAAALAMSRPPARKPREPNAPAADGFDFREAARTRIFWTLCAMQFLFLPTLTTLPLHIAIHGMDLGLTAAIAATLLSVIGAASAAGRLTIGAFSDRIGGKNSYILCFVPLILSLLALLWIETPWPLFVAIAVYGFAHGGFFTIVAPTIAEFFGVRAHGAIFGAVLFFGTIGGALGPILAGRSFDVTESYGFAFATLAAMAALGLVLALSLPSPRR